MDIISQYARLIGEIGLAGAACYALVRVWIQMISQADQHRKDNAEQDKTHRSELKELGHHHREELIALHRENRANVTEIVSRNMDEHRERNRVQTKIGMAAAKAFALNGLEPPDPYPNVDEAGKEDPRK